MFRILAGPPDRSALIPDQWWEVSDSCWKLETVLRPGALALVNTIEHFSCDDRVVDDGDTTRGECVSKSPPLIVELSDSCFTLYAVCLRSRHL